MSPTISGRPALFGVLIWLVSALVLGATGALSWLRPPAPQIFILLLVVLAILVSTRIPRVRRSVDAVSTRALVTLHTLRVVGAVFLILAARGEMSSLFAERAGLGDILVAILAIPLAFAGKAASSRHRLAFLAWNVLGMLDLIVAVSTAAFVVMRGDVPGMQRIVELPLALIPLFFVPLLFASHVALLRRLTFRDFTAERTLGST